MNILVCVKRVPDIGARIDLTEDRQAITTKNLGFCISPHEECAVEEAIQLVEKHGGQATVLTLGPADAEEQLRDCLARGIDRGILIETDQPEWDSRETATALAEVIRSEADKEPFDLILFGNESADSTGCQVGIRVAHHLNLPCVASVKKLQIGDGDATASREVDTGWEVFSLPMPALITVKEGINLPRYPSLRGTMKAKKKPVDRLSADKIGASLKMQQLVHPPEQKKEVDMLGEGSAAASRIVEVFKALEVI
ncbi:electron transfer flavoprotein subunit beta/FixA family protein [Desulforhopalus singaporensis]|uniref:Electron transfer flavoprotein beta subunit n=1 Tax=Desulforhopalus singaporensis TaxID=91360 RepID=A0A1H0U3G8_9BACT|nr:electron transfer flavoprotein subunit beta/FixA family protein [Desulforhopalus singaporensis]SDP60376.1 electron transfer flavoprotein beta subunit [Desulforhopalus singaporensis]